MADTRKQSPGPLKMQGNGSCPVRLLSVENGHSLGVCLPGYGDPVPKTPIVLCAVRLCASWKPTRAQSPPCLPGRSLRC